MYKDIAEMEFTSIDNEKNALYKRIEFQGKAYYNRNTFHTYDKVFGYIVQHISNWIKRETDIELREVEIVDKAPEAQRTKDSMYKQLFRSLLPRAIALQVLDPNTEKWIDYRTSDRIDRLNSSPKVSLINVVKQHWTREGLPFEYMKDIDMLIFGHIRMQNSIIRYSVMFNEYAKMYEFMEQLAFSFPLDVPKPIYAERIDNGYLRLPTIKRYTLETMLPDELIRDMKTILGIEDDGTDGDLALLEILKQTSKYPVEYIVDGGNRVRQFVVKYEADITLIPKSIEKMENEEGNLKIWGVQIEFLVNYLKVPIYGIRAGMTRLNLDCPALQVENNLPEEGHMKFYDKIQVANFTEFTDNKLSAINKFEIEYSEDDEVKDMNGHTHTVLDIIDTVAHEKVFVDYLDFLYTCYTEEERKDYIYIECKRKGLELHEESKPGMDPDFIVKDDIIIDKRGKAGKCIFVCLYINKEHYNKWLEQNNYISQNNFSAY